MWRDGGFWGRERFDVIGALRKKPNLLFGKSVDDNSDGVVSDGEKSPLPDGPLKDEKPETGTIVEE